jgi:hypothetical protein
LLSKQSSPDGLQPVDGQQKSNQIKDLIAGTEGFGYGVLQLLSVDFKAV